jgi:hypothetical protein
MPFTGSCHCGALHYACDTDPTGVMTCNCSICRRKSSVLHFVDGPQVRLTADPQALGIYRFNRQIIAHAFCRTCGISPWAEVNAPDGTHKVALNLRTSDFDYSALPATEYDGAAL